VRTATLLHPDGRPNQNKYNQLLFIYKNISKRLPRQREMVLTAVTVSMILHFSMIERIRRQHHLCRQL